MAARKKRAEHIEAEVTALMAQLDELEEATPAARRMAKEEAKLLRSTVRDLNAEEEQLRERITASEEVAEILQGAAMELDAAADTLEGLDDE